MISRQSLKSDLIALYVLVGIYLSIGLALFYFDPNPKPLALIVLLPLIVIFGLPVAFMGVPGAIVAILAIGVFAYLLIRRKYLAATSMFIALILLILSLMFFPTERVEGEDITAIPHGFPIHWMTQDHTAYEFAARGVWHFGENPTTASVVPLIGSYLILFAAVFGVAWLGKAVIRPNQTKSANAERSPGNIKA